MGGISAVLSMTRFLGRIEKPGTIRCQAFLLGIASVNSKKTYEKDRKQKFLYIYDEVSSPTKDKTRSIGYKQNRWFPMVVMAGLDQIHLLVAVLGLK